VHVHSGHPTSHIIQQETPGTWCQRTLLHVFGQMNSGRPNVSGLGQE
jgi:hypothetical protein